MDIWLVACALSAMKTLRILNLKIKIIQYQSIYIQYLPIDQPTIDIVHP